MGVHRSPEIIPFAGAGSCNIRWHIAQTVVRDDHSKYVVTNPFNLISKYSSYNVTNVRRFLHVTLSPDISK